MLRGDARRDELRPIRRRFHGGLPFAIPINGCTIEKMEDTCERTTGQLVMVQVGVDIGCRRYRRPIRLGGVAGQDLVHVTVHSPFPFILYVRGQIVMN